MTQLVSVTENDIFMQLTMDDGKRNAVSFAMAEELNAGLDRAEAAGKVVVLSGRPGTLSAGFDLKVMMQRDDDMVRLVRAGADLAQRMITFAQPVVLAVPGHALAMGALLCLAADYRIGVLGDFKIGLNEVAIGMTLPWFGVELARARLGSQSLNNSVGLARVYTPAEAAAVGYLDECVADHQLSAKIDEVASQLAALDSKAHHNTKLRARETLIERYEVALQKDFENGEVMASLG